MYLITKVVKLEESGSALNLCLNEGGRSHLHIATAEIVVPETEECVREKNRHVHITI